MSLTSAASFSNLSPQSPTSTILAKHRYPCSGRKVLALNKQKRVAFAEGHHSAAVLQLCAQVCCADLSTNLTKLSKG